MTPSAEALIKAARDVQSRAHAPYSRFMVGAALATPSGEVFTGCNVENASFGLTICAERSAVVAAVAAGHSEFSAIAVVSRGGVAPCSRPPPNNRSEHASARGICLTRSVRRGRVVSQPLQSVNYGRVLIGCPDSHLHRSWKCPS